MRWLFPNCLKRTQSCISSMEREERSKSIFDGTLKWEAYFWDHFLKCCRFNSRGDVINLKFGQRGPKRFHIPMTIERLKSIVKGSLRQSISFWNHYLKILKFWLPEVTSSTQKGSKRSKLVFHVLILIKRWKLKVKATLRWIIILWNHFDSML